MNTDRSGEKVKFFVFRRVMFILAIVSLMDPILFLVTLHIWGTMTPEAVAALTTNLVVPALVIHGIVAFFVLFGRQVRRTALLSLRSAWLVLVLYFIEFLFWYRVLTEDSIFGILLMAIFVIIPGLVISLIADAIDKEGVYEKIMLANVEEARRKKFFHFRRAMYRFIFISACIVPIWIGIGRGFWGIGGWGYIGTVLWYAPVLIVFHILYIIFVAGNIESKKLKLLSMRTSLILLTYLVAGIIFEISLVDGGDEDYFSVLSKVTNLEINNDVSGAICIWSFALTIGAGLLLLAFLALDKNKDMRQKNEINNMPGVIAEHIAAIKGERHISGVFDQERKRARRKWLIFEWSLLTVIIMALAWYGLSAIIAENQQKNHEENHVPDTVDQIVGYIKECQVADIVDDGGPGESKDYSWKHMYLYNSDIRPVMEYDVLSAQEKVGKPDSCNNFGVLEDDINHSNSTSL